MPDDEAPTRDRRIRLDLGLLWDDVVQARARVAAERHDPQHHVGPTARIALVSALEAYLSDISERGYPAPYSLVNELHLQRLACTRPPGAWGRIT